MKISVTFKTPGAVSNAVVGSMNVEDLDEHEAEDQEHELMKKFEKWVKYGELITVDFDLDAGTATVRGML